MSRSQGLERFLGCLNGWTCESALPLGIDRTDRTATRPRTRRVVRSPSTGSEHHTATRPRAYRLHCHSTPNATRGTFTIEWQCESHCHSALSVPRPHPFTATWPRAYRLHCHSALNATCGTFTVDWQCELHCHSAPSVLDHLAIISMSILRAGSRPRLYRSLGIKRQANRTVGALRPRSHVPTGQTILFSGGWELEHRR